MNRVVVRPLIGLVLVLSGVIWAAPVQASPTYRVGLQAGHWRSSELPDELGTLRGSTGTAAAGIREWEVNLDIAQRTATYLQQAGVTVDLLPATVPPNYLADAFVAVHADGSANTRLSGFKAATQWRDWSPGLALVEALRAEYGRATGLRWDGEHISSGMRGYYAMSSRRFTHTISTYTPAAILEMGYLTNPHDRRLMTQEADRLARSISAGILGFLRSKPAAGWPAPPPLPDLRAIVQTTTANLRAGPGTNFGIVRVVGRNRILLISEVRGDWLKLYSYRRRGDRWIHRDVVRLERISEEPPQDS